MVARKRKKKKPPRCAAKTKAGQRCKRRAVKGTRCAQHPPKKRGPKKGHGGRSKIVWSEQQWHLFESMCLLTNKRHRIATAMGHDEKTVDRLVSERHGKTFSEFLEQRYEAGNMKILAKQYEGAVGVEPRVDPATSTLIPGRPPNPTIQIWVGKNRLGQRDKRDLTSGGNPILPVGAIVITSDQLSRLPTDALRAIRSVVAAEALDDDS